VSTGTFDNEGQHRIAQFCEWLDHHRGALAASEIMAGALFVLGCIGFYSPELTTGSISLFLAGSVLFLLGASASALLDHWSAGRVDCERATRSTRTVKRTTNSAIPQTVSAPSGCATSVKVVKIQPTAENTRDRAAPMAGDRAE
jgi:hypothetical protein